MALLSAVLGIALYLVSGELGLKAVIAGTSIAAILGLLFLVTAVTLGASTPRMSAILFQGWILFPVALFAALSAGLIWFTVAILTLKGEKPPPTTEVVLGAIVAAVGKLCDSFLGSKRLLPSRVAEAAIKRRYRKKFPMLYGKDKPAYKNAYDALNRDALSDSAGPIHGWGFGSTRRRLALIRRGLAPVRRTKS